MILISEEIKEDWNCGYQIKNKILEIVGTNKAEVFLLGEIWGTILPLPRNQGGLSTWYGSSKVKPNKYHSQNREI